MQAKAACRGAEGEILWQSRRSGVGEAVLWGQFWGQAGLGQREPEEDLGNHLHRWDWAMIL